MNFCTKVNCFNCGDIGYKQINGVTMGSPLAPILAEIYLLKFEQSYIYSNFTVKIFFTIDMSIIYL